MRDTSAINKLDLVSIMNYYKGKDRRNLEIQVELFTFSQNDSNSQKLGCRSERKMIYSCSSDKSTNFEPI